MIPSICNNVIPHLFMDCELWFGRLSFSDAVPLLYNESIINPFLRYLLIIIIIAVIISFK